FEVLPAPQLAPLPDGEAERLRGLYYGFVHDFPLLNRLARIRNLRLLDLSTNSDQLGVSVSFWQGQQSSIRAEGVDLVSLGGPVEVFALPQVQWEPVRTIPNPKVGQLPDELASPDDGGPALIAARSVRLVPIAPLPVARAVVAAYNEQGERV